MKNKINALNDRKNSLLERIKEAEGHKKSVVNVSQSLIRRLQSGQIKVAEYKRRAEKIFGRKTAQEWVDYYDEYVAEINNKLKICDKEIRKEKSKRIIVKTFLILAGFLLLSLIY